MSQICWKEDDLKKAVAWTVIAESEFDGGILVFC
jgi:hypothetical protein